MPHLSRSAFHHSGQGSPMGSQGLPQFVNHRVPSFVCHQARSSRGPPQWPEMRQFGKTTPAGSSWGAERSFERLVFMTAVQPSSCGPLSQRKLTPYSQLASRKGTLTFPPRVCPTVLPFLGKGTPQAPREWGIDGGIFSLVPPIHGGQGLHNGYLVSPREVWRI